MGRGPPRHAPLGRHTGAQCVRIVLCSALHAVSLQRHHAHCTVAGYLCRGGLPGSAAVMVALATARARQRNMGWSDAAFGALVAAFPNSGFMGVPLRLRYWAQAAAAPAIVALALDMVVTSSVCIAISQGRDGNGVRNPSDTSPARTALLRLCAEC